MDDRRAHLAEAVWRVILDQGISAVSVRSVAAQASLAVGSLRHAFPTRAQLLLFSARLTVDRAAERIAAVPVVDDPRAYALAVLGEVLPLDPERRAEMHVNMALVADAPAEPELTRLRDEIHLHIATLCTQLLALIHPDRDPGIGARRLHALVDGVALHLLAQPAGASTAWALDLVAGELDRGMGD